MIKTWDNLNSGNAMNQTKIIEILMEKASELHRRPFIKVQFTMNPQANDLLNDLGKFPHAFVLACIMDRQIKAEKAWLIPYEISIDMGSFEFDRLHSLDLEYYIDIFKRKNLHRFNDIMAHNFHAALAIIRLKYNGNAAKIWDGNRKSASIILRFLELPGVGPKISSMAANILARDFKIPMQDYINIDISPDVHVKRVFQRLGFIRKDSSIEELIFSARELNPLHPGIFDFPAWEIGRQWCRPQNPHCNECYLTEYCPKHI